MKSKSFWKWNKIESQGHGLKRKSSCIREIRLFAANFPHRSFLVYILSFLFCIFSFNDFFS
ncbi:hypothetical protein CBFG_04906 [Clostridiales bacterium 1_7_47FAA]|nr:hypothetical protein CBFG_04906 [Clostridiales bacterium 1_7_47FAA]